MIGRAVTAALSFGLAVVGPAENLGRGTGSMEASAEAIPKPPPQEIVVEQQKSLLPDFTLEDIENNVLPSLGSLGLQVLELRPSTVPNHTDLIVASNEELYGNCATLFTFYRDSTRGSDVVEINLVGPRKVLLEKDVHINGDTAEAGIGHVETLVQVPFEIDTLESATSAVVYIVDAHTVACGILHNAGYPPNFYSTTVLRMVCDGQRFADVKPKFC